MSALCVICSTEKRPVAAQPNRHICFRCGTRLLEFVNGIEAAVLSIEKGSGGITDRRAPGFGSKSPAWDEPIAAMDYRTLPHEQVQEDDDGEPLLDDNGNEMPDGEINTFARSILASLHGVTRVIAEERGREWPQRITVETESRYLRSHLDWYAGRDDIDELFEDLRELHGYVQALDVAGEYKPTFIGKCPHLLTAGYCQEPLYAPPNGETVRCRKCRREWSRGEWLRLGRLLDDKPA